MNTKEYNQLLADIMLIPFTKPAYNTCDNLYEYAKAYCGLVDSRSKGRFSHNEAKKKLRKAKDDILKSFALDYRWNHLDDAQMLIDSFYPARKLQRYYDNEVNHLGKFYLRHICDIARTFVYFRDGLVSVRNWSERDEVLLNNIDGFHKIELWNYITRTVTPDIFIAAGYINHGVTDTTSLYNVPNLLCLCDGPLSKILGRGVAETHLHLKAGVSYSFLWKCCMEIFEHKEKTSELWYCSLFRLFSALYMESGSDKCFEDFIYGMLDKKMGADFYLSFLANGEKTKLPDFNTVQSLKQFLKKQNMCGDKQFNDILFDTVYKKYGHQGTSSEIIWYFELLKHLDKCYDPSMAYQLIMYLRIKNEYFSNKIQQTKIGGLDYFHSYYDNATELMCDPDVHSSEMLEMLYYSVFEEQCRSGNLEILEVKISPKIMSSSRISISSVEEMQARTLSQLQFIFKAYSKYIKDVLCRNGSDEVPHFPKLGIIFHFIKQNDADNFSGYSCAVNDKSDEFDCVDYNTMRKLNARFIDSLHGLLEKFPILADYIVGIDAASTENSAEPWVFAPIYRKLRPDNYVFAMSYETKRRINSMGMTYHVGEDFRHIISGLRHIDEVLTYFNFRAGDRLGHAIALGIDIDSLITKNRIVVLPAIEHLENLLWMWEKCKKSCFENAPQNLEFKIMETAGMIYDSTDNLDVYKLWQVYDKKFQMFNAEQMFHPNYTKSGCKLLEEHKFVKDFDWLLCSHYCPCFFEQYHKPIFVRITNDEIQFYKELQKDMISKVERMGVYVETNPSSNLVIGDISSIFSHPIIRLNQIDHEQYCETKSSVLVSINSDDPIVFSTSVENEMAYIYYSMLNLGCSRESALMWINKVREHGIDSSFIKHNKTVYSMLSDFDEIKRYSMSIL